MNRRVAFTRVEKVVVFPISTLVGTVVVLVLAIRTGQAGGELVYRHGAAEAYTTGDSGETTGDDDETSPSGRDEHDHDED